MSVCLVVDAVHKNALGEVIRVRCGRIDPHAKELRWFVGDPRELDVSEIVAVIAAGLPVRVLTSSGEIGPSLRLAPAAIDGGQQTIALDWSAAPIDGLNRY